MLENESASVDYLGPDHIHRLEKQLIIKLQGNDLTEEERQQTTWTLKRLKLLKEIRNEVPYKGLLESNDRDTFLPGGKLFYNNTEITGGLPELEKDLKFHHKQKLIQGIYFREGAQYFIMIIVSKFSSIIRKQAA